MSTDDDDPPVYVTVEVCKNCPDIHLVMAMEGEQWRGSIALTEDEWATLIADYHALRQRLLSPGGGKLQ